jgi:hypothetical protein
MANLHESAKTGMRSDVIPQLRDPWWFNGVFFLFKILWWIFLPLGRLALELSCLVKPLSPNEAGSTIFTRDE